MKEKKVVRDITAVTIGPKASVETLRTSLAMGADTAIAALHFFVEFMISLLFRKV